METIDLFDELKPEESCIVVDNSMLYEVVRRIHRQRSYKVSPLSKYGFIFYFLGPMV